MSDKSERYLHISISAMKSVPSVVWVQWTQDQNRAKTAWWNNACFNRKDGDEIKALLTKLVTEL